MILNREKCGFLKDQVTFFDMTISKEEASIDNSKIDALNNLTKSKFLTKIRASSVWLHTWEFL